MKKTRQQLKYLQLENRIILNFFQKNKAIKSNQLARVFKFKQ